MFPDGALGFLVSALRPLGSDYINPTQAATILTFGSGSRTAAMLLAEKFAKFVSILLNLQTRIQTTYVEKEAVSFDSENPLGACPGSLTGALHSADKCLVVVQEWWGMNEQIKQQAADIAKQGGFLTLVPDLYRGKVANTPPQALHLVRNLDYNAAIKDIRGAAKFLLQQGCRKVGITGFCMGGSLSLAAAVLVSEVSAAAPFYGIPPDSLADVSKIKIPLQCHFGKQDVSNTASPAKYAELRSKLDAGGVDYEFHEYDAGHAFTNPQSQNYNEAIAKRSVGRMINFVKQKLQ